jgi:hypothetical protein
MRLFWLTGESGDNGNPVWRVDGSLPDSTACIPWYSDGIDVAFIFNERIERTPIPQQKIFGEILNKYA